MTTNEDNRQRAPIRRWFDADHLPAESGAVVALYARLADELIARLPIGAETTTALRKLLESKDAAVRAAIEGADRAESNRRALAQADQHSNVPSFDRAEIKARVTESFDARLASADPDK